MLHDQPFMSIIIGAFLCGSALGLVFSANGSTGGTDIIGRGCTILDGMGGYSRQPAKVIIVMVKQSESILVFRLVKEIDPKAFISQTLVRGVYGEGFDPIKT